MKFWNEMKTSDVAYLTLHVHRWLGFEQVCHCPPDGKSFYSCWCISSVFGSVVAGAFQIAFRAEMHANDVFLFFKNHFWHQHIKTIQKVQTALTFSTKKKNFKFWRNAGTNAVPNVPLVIGPNWIISPHILKLCFFTRCTVRYPL